ncbi:MAG: dihydropteroate synthase [Prevotellaceae bacterium]|nr:dihydropteroate synthase [Prevotellaceae bacterium]
MDLDEPKVMGILNVTPDSFYDGSRVQTEKEILTRAEEILAQGGDVIDVGACSTRPDSQPASEEEEWARLCFALRAIRREMPEAVISVDTFRASIACRSIEEYGADIINDVSEGADEGMFRVVAEAGVPYILTSQQKNMYDTLLSFSAKVLELRNLGQKDILLDPGFGFGKTHDGDFLIMSELNKLLCMELPVVVGVSRKSMIYRTLDISPSEALNSTTALNTIALTKGASILRVHDVAEAKQVVRLFCKL